MGKSIDRLVVLGLDGATWTVLDPMRRRGLMPNLDALLKSAAHGTLTSIIPPVTTAAWTTMMTGCNPPRHGVFDHRYYDAAAGRMKVNHSGRIRVPTALASALGRRAERRLPELAGAVSSSQPPRSGRLGNGRAASRGGLAGLSRVRGPAPGRGSGLLAALLLEARAADARGADAERPVDRRELSRPAQREACWPTGTSPTGPCSWSSSRTSTRSSTGPGVTSMWMRPGSTSPSGTQAAAEVIRGLDAAIGLLCELADRRGAAVLAVSDHGFGPCLGRVDVNRILLDAGVARLPGRIGNAPPADQAGP